MATGDFNIAVEKLIDDGLPRDAATQLIAGALARGEPMGLVAWADHLLAQRAEYRRQRVRTP